MSSLCEKLKPLDENIFAWSVSLNIHIKYSYKVECGYPRASYDDVLDYKKKIIKIYIYISVCIWKRKKLSFIDT